MANLLNEYLAGADSRGAAEGSSVEKSVDLYGTKFFIVPPQAPKIAKPRMVKYGEPIELKNGDVVQLDGESGPPIVIE